VNKKLRINFILPAYTPRPHGGLRVVFEYADFLATHGHEVTLVFPRQLSPRSGAVLDALKSRLWGVKQRLRNRPLIPWHALQPTVRVALVPGVADRFIADADVVVATMWSTAEPVARLSPAKGHKYYLIQGYETWAGPVEQVNATWHLPLRKIVISKWLEDIGRGLGAAQMRHIPNGLDLARFKVTNPPELRPAHVLSLYHRAEVKGIADALAVLQSYHARFPDIRVSMFGLPPRGDEIPDWITYLRNPPQEVLVKEFYNQGTIYLGASRNEGWGLPPAEAMACGCVFIGTDIGGFRDYATHGETALLSPVRDHAALLRNLIAVTEDRDLWRRLQKRGTEAIQQFTWERSGTALERYFLECL
jgi:glycosyltransferase involved in cell wall biosynthesis